MAPHFRAVGYWVRTLTFLNGMNIFCGLHEVRNVCYVKNTFQWLPHIKRLLSVLMS